MPIYQYVCENCDHEMEAFQKMSDPVLVDCTQCNEPTLRKQVTAAAFRLKGTGWYETDFKGGNNSGKKGADKTAKQDSKKEAAPKGTSTSTATASNA